MASVKLWVYTVIHNEARLLPFFLSHYAPLAARVIVYDDASDDGGPEIAARWLNAEVRRYPGQARMDDHELADFAASAYPEARGQADWVIWVDADEFIYHPVLLDRLARYQAEGVDLPKVAGYDMYADEFPAGEGQLYELVRQGARAPMYDKPVVFQPRLDLRWIPGKHAAAVSCGNRRGPAELKLLHFRCLGRAHFEARNAHNWARMSERNKAAGLGYQVYPANDATHGWEARTAALRPRLEVVT